MEELRFIIEKLNEETDWEGYIPRGKNAVAITHRWVNKRKYFKTEEVFKTWAKEELGGWSDVL